MNTLIPFLFKKILLFSKLLRIFYIPPFHTMAYHFKYIQNSTFLQSLLTQLLPPLFPDEAIYVYNLRSITACIPRRKQVSLTNVYLFVSPMLRHPEPYLKCNVRRLLYCPNKCNSPIYNNKCTIC